MEDSSGSPGPTSMQNLAGGAGNPPGREPGLMSPQLRTEADVPGLALFSRRPGPYLLFGLLGTHRLGTRFHLLAALLHPLRTLMLSRCAALLNSALADRNLNGLSIACGLATVHHRIEAIFPQTVIDFPLPHNESQILAFVENLLASRVT